MQTFLKGSAHYNKPFLYKKLKTAIHLFCEKWRASNFNPNPVHSFKNDEDYLKKFVVGLSSVMQSVNVMISGDVVQLAFIKIQTELN